MVTMYSALVSIVLIFALGAHGRQISTNSSSVAAASQVLDSSSMLMPIMPSSHPPLTTSYMFLGRWQDIHGARARFLASEVPACYKKLLKPSANVSDRSPPAECFSFYVHAKVHCWMDLDWDESIDSCSPKILKFLPQNTDNFQHTGMFQPMQFHACRDPRHAQLLRLSFPTF